MPNLPAEKTIVFLWFILVCHETCINYWTITLRAQRKDRKPREMLRCNSRYSNGRFHCKVEISNARLLKLICFFFSCTCSGESCVDQLQTYCADVSSSACTGFYAAWFRQNCAKKCGACNSCTCGKFYPRLKIFLPTSTHRFNEDSWMWPMCFPCWAHFRSLYDKKKQ